MYFNENVKRLKEIGLTEKEINKAKKGRGRWILEYCRPEDAFLLKIAYFVKSRAFPKYEVIEGGEEAEEHFERNVEDMIRSFVFECEESAEKFMKDSFKEFLFIPKKKLGVCHFKVLADFLLSSRKGPKVLCFFVDFKVHVFKKKQVFLHSLSMGDCGVIQMGKGKKKWIYAGPLTQEYPREVMESTERFADLIFTSEWYQKLLKLSEIIRELPSEEYSQKIKKLTKIKMWFDVLKEVRPALHRIERVPFSLTSEMFSFSIFLLDEYMRM